MHVFVKPLFTAIQLLPLFVDRFSPLSVPANMFDPLTIIDFILWLLKPLEATVHVLPLLEDLKSPKSVPAKTNESHTANDKTVLFASPLFTAAQLLPVSEEKNTPSLAVPAKMFDPLTVNDKMFWEVKPL